MLFLLGPFRLRSWLLGSVTVFNGNLHCPVAEDEIESLSGRGTVSFQELGGAGNVRVGVFRLDSFLGVSLLSRRPPVPPILEEEGSGDMVCNFGALTGWGGMGFSRIGRGVPPGVERPSLSVSWTPDMNWRIVFVPNKLDHEAREEVADEGKASC